VAVMPVPELARRTLAVERRNARDGHYAVALIEVVLTGVFAWHPYDCHELAHAWLP
jgi:hypothetical protein